MVDVYLGSERRRASGAEGPEVRAMMIRILLERYLKRVPQTSLFDDEIDVAPSMPLKADANVHNAAKMQLYHEFGRPYFFGFDTLCDAASENAERFLRLAGKLVQQLEIQLIRRSGVTVAPRVQDELLKERATRMIEEEDLPERVRVLKLCETVATQCLTVTREPNAPLAQGPNAWGIPQADFDTIAVLHPELAYVLQSGVAYNMFTLVRDYGTKGKLWCLVELSGTWSLAKGLSLNRGGFLERKVTDLLSAIQISSGDGQ
jgi:CRISPR/Cas system-associated endoribonuclease Cas2